MKTPEHFHSDEQRVRFELYHARVERDLAMQDASYTAGLTAAPHPEESPTGEHDVWVQVPE